MGSGSEEESEEDSDGDDEWGNFDVEEEDTFSPMPYSQPQQQSQPQPDLFDSFASPAAIHPTAKTFSSSQSHSEFLSFSFSVLIKQRAKLLPVSEQYYRDLHSFKK